MTPPTQLAAELADPATPASTATPGVVILGGQTYLRDAKGALVPTELVKAQHKLEDETVRKVFGYAETLSAQITRFRGHTFDDVDGLISLLAQEYSDHRGGTKGNITLTSFDGTRRVQVQVAETIAFGPELQIARNLVDECLQDWSSDARPEIRAVVQQAFDTDKEGQVSRTRLVGLLRLDIVDPRWVSAMAALRDSMRVDGTKRYVRFYRRAKATDKWEAVSIDMASA